MNLFGAKRLPDDDSGVEALRELIKTYDDRLRALERGHKGLELEWENTYDKIHKAVSRLNKRQRDADKREAAAQETTDEPEGVETPSDLRARILKRRRHG